MLYWWEAVLGTVSTFSVGYILDTSLPWSKTADTHVFERPASPAHAQTDKHDLHRTFVAAVARRIFDSAKPTLKQPLVFWVDNNIAARSNSKAFLEELRESPPYVHGSALKMVSKAPPLPMVCDDAPTLKKEDFIAQLDVAVREELLAPLKLSVDQISILAGFYEVPDIPGGPVTTGEIILICSDFPDGVTPKLLGAKFSKKVYGP